MPTTTTLTSWIADRSAASAKVAKFNAQLVKWGLDGGAATLTFSGATTLQPLNEVAVVLLGCDGAEHFPGAQYVRLYEATVTYAAVKLPGDYRLAAVVAHGEANIVCRAPSFDGELDEALWAAAPTCDHCGTVRARNETILVHSAAEGFCRVGTSCVRPYLGVDGAHLLGYTLAWASLLDEDEGTLTGHAGTLTLDYVTAAALCIAASGFRSTSGDFSTRDGAWSLLSDRRAPAAPAAWATAHATATAALVWAQALVPSSDFDRNLLAAASCGVLDRRARGAGILAYLPEAYLKAVAKRAEASTVDSNEHVATVGAKVSLTLTVTRLAQLEPYSYNGPAGLRITGRDEAGHTIQIYTTVATAIGQAALATDTDKAPVKLAGTVKSHTEYNERRITVLTRCKPVTA